MKSVVYEIKGNPSYSGSTDTNTRSFANGVYAHKMFVTYNERFFKGALEEVPFVFVDAMFSNGWLGYVDYEYFDTSTKSRVYYCNPSTLTYGNITIKPCVMYLVDSDWASRFHFENVLLHEMCHLYQVQVLCGCDLKTYDDELNTAVDHEHGDKFHESASLVNGSSFNTEGFLVTDNADDTYLVYRLDERNLSHGLKRGLFMNSRRHYEVTSRDIPNLSDRRSNARSRSSNIVARYQSFDKEKGEIRYNVTSQTKAGKSYTVSFRFKNWHPDMNHLDDEIQHSMKGDIEIDCTCPAFEFQGYKYLATLKGGSIEAERRPPDKTNRDRHGFACKHILKAIDSFNQDFDKFRSEGKGLIRKRNLRVQHKYESKHICKKASWFVIDDGTFDLPIVTEDNLTYAMNEVIRDMSDYALEQMEQSILQNRITNDFVWNLIRHHNHERMNAKADMWITVYAVTDDVIDRWNRYGTDTIDTDNPTAYQIRKVLFCDKDSGDYGLLDLLRSTPPVLHQYIPALLFKDSRNGNNQSILGRLDILIKELSLEVNHG